MNERDYIQRLIDILRALLYGELALIETDYAVEFPDGLRRYIDLLSIGSQSGTYIFKVQHFVSLSFLDEWYIQLTQLARQLLNSKTSNTGDRITLFLVLVNITRVEYQTLIRDQENFQADRFLINFRGIILLFADDFFDPSIGSRIGQAPPFDFTVIDFPVAVPRKQQDVFISYRRADTSWAAGRIADYLRTIYDPSCIFFDTRSIDWGDDFVQVIKKRVNTSNILIAVIGQQWLKIAYSDSGTRRLDDPNDFVRIEVSTALNNNLLVIPILVDDAVMPPSQFLPVDLQHLSYRNAGKISATNFHVEITPLIDRLDKEKVMRLPSKRKRTK